MPSFAVFAFDPSLFSPMEIQVLDAETCQVVLDGPRVVRLRQGSARWDDASTAWREIDKRVREREAVYLVRLWGRTQSGESICVVVTDPVSTFYRRMGTGYTTTQLQALASCISDNLQIPAIGSGAVSAKVVWRHTTNGWIDDPSDPSRPALLPWLAISGANNFIRSAATSACTRAEKSMGLVGALTPITAERNVEVHTELLLKVGVRPGGWLLLSPGASSTAMKAEGRAVCALCAQALTSDLSPATQGAPAPIRILSFDIECFSESGAFPDPLNPEDPIIAIGMYEKTLFAKNQAQANEVAAVVYLGEGVTLPASSVEAGHRVLCYESEEKLLLGFAQLFRASDADVVVGYNTCLFDWRYIAKRVELLKDMGRLSDGAAKEIFSISRVRRLHCPSVEATVASSAMGDNPLHHPRIPGRFEIDLWFYLKRQNNPGLPNLKLDTVSAHYLGERKHDLPAQQMFARHREGAEGQGIVAAYCVQDTKLVVDLIEKLDVLPNVLQMANVTSVTPQDINFRGQQIKVYTQIIDKAHKLGYVVEDSGSTGGRGDGGEEIEYSGAHVVDPTVGYYRDPILTLDFASLYPSLIQTYNLSFDTRVTRPDTKAPSVVVPNTEHRFVSSSVRRGLLPLILDELLAERKRVRKLAAQTSDKLQKSLLNCTQLALKISANSCYGFTGSTRGLMTCIEVAESTTGAGREIIHFSSETIEREWPGSHVVYGDSVTGDTPLIVRRRRGCGDSSAGVVQTIRIDELDDGGWFTCAHDNDKEEAIANVQVWQDGGFTDLLRVIRHKCTKSIMRVVTREGLVDCTEDHSLLRPDGTEVSPKEVSLGTNLLHVENDSELLLACHNDGDFIADYEAYALGRWMTTSSTDKLKEVGPVTRHGRGFKNGHKEWRVPPAILGAPLSTVEAFWKGLFGHEAEARHVVMGKELLAGLWILARRLGYQPSLNIEGRCQSSLRLLWDDRSCSRRHSHEIIALHTLGHTNNDDGFVYDLQTQSHHFHVAPGNLVVHNTDSCFVRLPEKLRGLGEQELFDLGEEMAERITKDFAARLGVSQQSFVTLEMEKFLRPLVLYKKKRYAGLCYEEPGKPPKMCVKGIEMVRRDAAPILRSVQEKVLDAIIREDNAEAGVSLAREAVEKVLALPPGGPFLDIAQSKTLRAKYAAPDSMAHVCVVNLMNERNPGSAPRVGERISFVVVASETPRVVDKVEDVGYAEEEGLPPDWAHYVDMLERPLMRLLDVPLSSMGPEKLRAMEVFFLDAKHRAKAQVCASSLARHGTVWVRGHKTTRGTQLKLTDNPSSRAGATVAAPPRVTPPSATSSHQPPIAVRAIGWQPLSSKEAAACLPAQKKRKTAAAATEAGRKNGGVTLDAWLKRSPQPTSSSSEVP